MTPTFGPTLSTILSITVVHNNFDDDLINNNHHFRDASSPDCSNSDADHNNSTPVPQSPGSNPRFWEIGNRREDSSVQVAMEHVQFGL
ncbi:8088_t:CDS:2 [Entrophospora sp. SA101]|nr:8088_t:CDS:2 [Entrophospora sp. SA101]